MRNNIELCNPYLINDRDSNISMRICPTTRFKGGGSSSAEYEAQLEAQRLEREQAEAEAAALEASQDAAEAERKKRAGATYLTGSAAGDSNTTGITKKSYLGSGM